MATKTNARPILLGKGAGEQAKTISAVPSDPFAVASEIDVLNVTSRATSIVSCP